MIAFVDVLGTTYYAQTDKIRYRENLIAFKDALTKHASLLKGIGQVYFFSDCAYLSCTKPPKLIDYLTEVRGALLLQHIYLQAAVESGSLSPTSADDDIVLGTIFGADVAGVYARQHALKGAAIRVSDGLVASKTVPLSVCVKSCHLPNPNNSVPDCFWDIRYPPKDIDRLQLEYILADCLKAKSVRRSAGTYYISILVSMIRSADWRSVNLEKKSGENRTGARYLYDMLIYSEFNRHFGDLRGSEFIYFALLDETYKQCEEKPICNLVREYLSMRPRLLRRIEAVPDALLSNRHRDKFLDYTLKWSNERHSPENRSDEESISAIQKD